MSSLRRLSATAVAAARKFVIEKAVEWALLTLGAIILGWIWSIYLQWNRLDPGLAPKQVIARLGWQAFNPANAFDYLNRWFWGAPFRSLALVALLVGYYVLIVSLARVRRTLDQKSDLLEKAEFYEALVKSVGLGGRWPHAAVDGSGAPWEELRKEILRPDNGIFYFLGANGIETFGGAQAPLHDALQKFRGSVRVILADPKNNRHIRGRAKSLSVPFPEYQRAIKESVACLKKLKSENHAVEGRFYSSPPNWKMVVTSTTVWLQYYEPGSRHVADTPVFRFDASGVSDGTGLYHLFQMEFNRIWERCEKMDLEERDNQQRVRSAGRRQ